jgi:hypothetical protein
MSKKVGEKLYDNLFTAVRNSSGNYTSDLFNGFDTITAAAETGSKLSGALGNFQDLTATTISKSNAGDILIQAYRDLDRIIRKQNVNLYLPVEVVWMYEDWYQAEFGTQAWNQGYTQKQLVSTKCNLVPLDNMGGNYAYFTVKENLNVGFDQQSDVETVRIRECDNPKTVQFFMKSYFGAGFETLQKEYLTVLKIDAGLGSGSV